MITGPFLFGARGSPFRLAPRRFKKVECRRHLLSQRKSPIVFEGRSKLITPSRICPTNTIKVTGLLVSI